MRRELVSLLSVMVLATAGLATGCGGELRDALPSPTRSIEAPTRSLSPLPSDTEPESSSAPAPSRETETKTETKTESPAPVSDEGPSIPWLWIVLGVLVVVLGIVLLSTAFRRSRDRRDWVARTLDACARGTALRNDLGAALMMPPGPGAEAGWAALQRGAYDLNQVMYLVRDTAPNEDERRAVDDVIVALQALRSALATDRRSVADQLFPFEDALATLHDRVSL